MICRHPRVSHGRNRLYGQCGMSAPVFTGADGAPSPLRPCLVSICKTLRNVTQTTLSLPRRPFFAWRRLYASYAPLFHVGAPSLSMAIRGALTGLTDSPVSHGGVPIVPHGAPLDLIGDGAPSRDGAPYDSLSAPLCGAWLRPWCEH